MECGGFGVKVANLSQKRMFRRNNFIESVHGTTALLLHCRDARATMAATKNWGLGRNKRKKFGGSPMEIFHDTAKLSRPALECAQCGNPIYIPVWSEWVDSSRARHLWECEACGYAFETTVRFATAA
jgi:hypothetical protein